MNDRSAAPGSHDRLLPKQWRAWLSAAEIPDAAARRSLSYRVLRVLHPLWLDLDDGQLSLRAMGLVYTTLLSLTPLLAVAFSLLKAFGVHNQVEPLLENLLAPLGEQGGEISRRLIGFVDNMRVGVLGFTGLALLFYTVISLVQKIEQAFNVIWGVDRQRSFAQRFGSYLGVIIVGPVLVFSAIGLSASLVHTPLAQWLLSQEPFGSLYALSTRLLPFFLISGAFGFFYLTIPNTLVKPTSALVGGVCAGILWIGAGWLFSRFVAGSDGYTAIYSAFATLILFMIWLHLAWLILLAGATIAHHHQYPRPFPAQRRHRRPSGRMLERLGLSILVWIGQNHYRRLPPWDLESLSRRAGLPMEMVKPVLHTLESAGLLTRSREIPATWIPGAPLEETSAATVLRVLRQSGERSFFHAGHLCCEPPVDRLMTTLEETLEKSLQPTMIKDLALSPE